MKLLSAEKAVKSYSVRVILNKGYGYIRDEMTDVPIDEKDDNHR